jgi:hypothetical protein
MPVFGSFAKIEKSALLETNTGTIYSQINLIQTLFLYR